jgi:hypothetical protein
MCLQAYTATIPPVLPSRTPHTPSSGLRALTPRPCMHTTASNQHHPSLQPADDSLQHPRSRHTAAHSFPPPQPPTHRMYASRDEMIRTTPGARILPPLSRTRSNNLPAAHAQYLPPGRPSSSHHHLPPRVQRTASQTRETIRDDTRQSVTHPPTALAYPLTVPSPTHHPCRCRFATSIPSSGPVPRTDNRGCLCSSSPSSH